MTYDGLTKTLAANVQGLDATLLASTVESEARQLRESGVDVVVVLAHAGGRCMRFDDPANLSSCDDDAEVFRLARRLPRGLVDAIVAGHSHAAVAHVVAGIPIVQAYSAGRSFARVDLVIERGTGAVSAEVFAPQDVTPGGRYEGLEVEPDAAVVAAMKLELQRVEHWRETPIGVVLDAPVEARRDTVESALGNLFADALLASVPSSDVAIGLGARRGGLRATLPAGSLTRGLLYDAFPFDNRVVTLELTGSELQQVLVGEVTRGRRGLLSVSGIQVRVACETAVVEVEVVRASGAPIAPTEMLTVATMDTFATRFALDSPPRISASSLAGASLVREVVGDWLAARGGTLRGANFTAAPRWEVTSGCVTG